MRLFVNKKALVRLTKGMKKTLIAQKCGVSYQIIQNVINGATATITDELAVKLSDAINYDYKLFTDGVASDCYRQKESKKVAILPCNEKMIMRVAKAKRNNPELIADTILKNEGIKNQTTFTNKKQILDCINVLGIHK